MWGCSFQDIGFGPMKLVSPRPAPMVEFLFFLAFKSTTSVISNSINLKTVEFITYNIWLICQKSNAMYKSTVRMQERSLSRTSIKKLQVGPFKCPCCSHNPQWAFRFLPNLLEPFCILPSTVEDFQDSTV